jgi:hypothetical protein
MIQTPNSGMWVIKIDRTSDKGTVWGNGFQLANGGHTMQDARFVRSEQVLVVKIEVDDVLPSSLAITEKLSFRPRIAFTVG